MSMLVHLRRSPAMLLRFMAQDHELQRTKACARRRLW